MSKYYLVLTTVPDEEKAHEIARRLVEEKLAACVTVSSPCHSFYWWEEKITQDKEYILFIKTKASLYSELEERIRQIHPYQVPEILGLPIEKGSASYLNWLEKETK